jgi:8-oxo-dGTP pyrophosphatase MutT (NUDIX family)
MALVLGMTPDVVPIRPAATVVLWRAGAEGAQVLMGQRGAQAAFMPSKYVFPGGAVDPEDADHAHPLPGLSQACRGRLALFVPTGAPGPDAIAHAALRELDEETGLIATATAPMTFVFRAITPPGRGRRFDARFFLIKAKDVTGDLDGFSNASAELSHLHWIGMDAARNLDLPFITEIVLSEVAAILQGQDQPGAPFFDNSGPQPAFRRLD